MAALNRGMWRIVIKLPSFLLTIALLRLVRSTPQASDSAPAIKPAVPGTAAHEQVITPWDVQGSVADDGRQLAIDYDKLIRQFGTRPVDSALLERFEKVTGHRPHPLLRRGTFFSHR